MKLNHSFPNGLLASRIFILFRKHWILLSFLVSLLFLIVQCTPPEKKLDSYTQIFPIDWLDEDTLLIGEGNSISIVGKDEKPTLIFRHDDEDIYISFRSSCFTAKKWLMKLVRIRKDDGGIHGQDLGVLRVDIERDAKNIPLISSKKMFPNLGAYINYSDCTVQLGYPGINKTIVLGSKTYEPQPFKDASNQGHIGTPLVFDRAVSDRAYFVNYESEQFILNYQNNSPRIIRLPPLELKSTTALSVRRDPSTGFYFVYHTECPYKAPADSCPRRGWWLDENLNVVKSLRLPDINLIKVEESLKCFSCGCGCYTHHETYVLNGEIYAHIWGFPIPNQRRGLYVLRTDEGVANWEQLISGRIEAPVAISPSNCKIAYYKVSSSGDKLVTQEICAEN